MKVYGLIIYYNRNKCLEGVLNMKDKKTKGYCHEENPYAKYSNMKLYDKIKLKLKQKNNKKNQGK